MLRSIGVLGIMAWHYMKNTRKRHLYSVHNKTLTNEEKRANRQQIYQLMQELSVGMIKAAGTEIEVIGRENLPDKGPVVYMANHKGQYDSPVLAVTLQDAPIFIGKEEMQKMPIISQWFNAMGCIYLSRDDMKQSLKAILQGIDELKSGQSIVIFPEGTRHKEDTGMGTFKAGSFKLATKANVPIVPIAIQNTHKVLEEKGYIQKAKVTVCIGEMIDTAALTTEEKKGLPVVVEEQVAAMLESITNK